MGEIWKNLDINDLDGEIWKDIDDFPDYQISNLGRIKSFKRYHGTNERILGQHKRRKYLSVILYKNRERNHKSVHILVFETFGDYKLKPDEDIHHIDKNEENNNFNNLIMMPESEHCSFHNKGKHHSEETRKKMSESHTDFKGENAPNSKLKEEQVIQIKLLLKEGILTQQEIADMFGVSQLTISAIKTGKIWNHIKLNGDL
jgi:predicted XRE-type DNA-binding protein